MAGDLMASGNIPNGERTYSSSLAAADDVDTVTSADRYGYVTVTNLGTSGALYVTSDGTTPSTSGASNTQFVPAGESRIIANEMPLWFQSSTVIQKGANQFGGGNTSTSPSSPGSVQAQRSLAGDEGAGPPFGNPGTTINIAGSGNSYVIEAAG